MLTTTSPTAVLPEGYVASERIGSGGYGEVWRATAPGGVDKAVKIIYGHCDDELAERELKSMERIREVRHPFVISLERFDVIDGRLIIVTELADSSLDASFQKHHDAGQPGIPREVLIGYLCDAAEALDYLVDYHSLQHLDIKPENLLLVGDHIKLGDFGLVKELATRTTNSMMGGMTPVYSAPEVFDDKPSPRSDQYSLAIVYQQMLTGQLPFPGRTPAQLAKQHTQAEPMLRSLSDEDQLVIGRALAKRPEHRYDSCKSFVSALLEAGTKASKARTTSTGYHSSPRREENEDTKSSRSLLTEPVPPRTEVLGDGSIERSAAKKADCEFVGLSEEVINQATALPTLAIGLGGLGIEMLQAVRDRDPAIYAQDPSCSPLRYVAIDTDRNSFRGYGESCSSRLDSSEYVHISLKRPKEYGEQSRDLLRWVSRRWLYNIPRSLETRGYRPLGRIAVVDHAKSVLEALYAKLYKLLQACPDTKKVRVVILAGSGGGTGSGIVVDVAQAINSLVTDLGIHIQTDAIVGVPERSPGSADSFTIVNTHSLLTELSHVQKHGNQSATPLTGVAERLESTAAPFNSIYWLPIPPRNQRAEHHEVLSSVAEQVVLHASESAAAGVFHAGTNRNSNGCLQSFWLATGDLAGAVELSRDQLSRMLDYPYQCATVAIGRDVEQMENLQTVKADHSEATVLSVALGIQPREIEASLAKYFPDIADAAGRVHTRCDIEWLPLETTTIDSCNSVSAEAQLDTSTLKLPSGA